MKNGADSFSKICFSALNKVFLQIHSADSFGKFLLFILLPLSLSVFYLSLFLFLLSLYLQFPNSNNWIM